ncbi:MAG TPA: PAS domain S-box protein, partial [Anaeromyxobacteraceae bacterium]|nr:PAS domain S-box protein [Anaeromyxobacteraceae bacterium]
MADLDAVPLPVFLLARDGAVVAWNAAAARAFGWEEAEVAGAPPAWAGDAARAMLAAAAARAAGEGWSGELEVDGALRGAGPVRLRLRAGPWAGGAAFAVVGQHDLPVAPGWPAATAAPGLQDILDAIPAPIWVKDVQGVYRTCNTAFERSLGLPREAIIGRTVYDVAPADLAETYRHADEALMGAGGMQVYESRVQWSEGARREVIFQKSTLRAADGSVAGLAGTMLDVTEQRAAERQLRARLAQQAAVARLARLALDDADIAELIGEATRAARDLTAGDLATAWRVVEREGSRWLERLGCLGAPEAPVRLPPGDGLALAAFAGDGPVVYHDLPAETRFAPPPDLLAAGMRSGASTRIGGRDAPLGVLSVHSRRPHAFGPDEIAFFDAVARVLSIALGRRRALDALHQSEASFRRLVEHSPDLVVVHADQKVLYANPALARVIEAPQAEIAGMSVLSYVQADDRALIAPRLLHEGSLGPVVIRLLSRGGRETPVEFVSISAEWGGQPARVGIGRDVSERRRLEARLALAQRMAAVGTLAAGVAHELNNPLTFVLANLGYAAGALRNMASAPGGPPALGEVLGALEEAAQGADRMRVIVGDLRTFARGDDARPGPVPLRRVLEYAAKLAGHEIRGRARLDWEPSDGAPDVLGNEARLGQVFLNLLMNAAQAIAPGAADGNAIRIAVRSRPEGRVAVEIRDTGRGMGPEVRARIFDPFFTTKAPGEGTGLGLWVCHNIVAAHGGEIEVESEPGQGTTIRVILPAAGAAGAAAPGPGVAA